MEIIWQNGMGRDARETFEMLVTDGVVASVDSSV